jgi:hypothetical protein
MNTPLPLPGPDWKRLQWTSLYIGGAGLVLCAAGAFFDPQQFCRSYLIAFTAWTGIALGSLALWMLHNLTGGMWGLILRRFLEAATRTLPLLVLAFLPVALGLPEIYSWAGHGDSALIDEHNAKPHYLNVPFFVTRTGIYFACWLALSFFLNRWSAEQDRSADPRPAERMEALSGPGLVIYALTVTLAAVDWIMSLEPAWSSTIFGVLVATGQMLPALGLAIALATWFAARPSPHAFPAPHEGESGRGEEITTPENWNDLGSLLFAFVMLWTYMMFSQLLLIWSGNLPEEITYYLIRSDGGWQWVGVMLAVFYFGLPFALLLSRDVKRDPRKLRIVALALVGMSFIHQFWMIAPVFSPHQLLLHWMDVAALAGLGGFWFAYYFRQLQARPLLPVYWPKPAEEVSHA